MSPRRSPKRGPGASATVGTVQGQARGRRPAAVSPRCEIAESSGNKRLDDMALAAVQHARYRRPPPGMTPSQLTYEVPYHFR